jgi:hypothetical protein
MKPDVNLIRKEVFEVILFAIDVMVVCKSSSITGCL